jgi:GNAT superfamily N-acetyltransferase
MEKFLVRHARLEEAGQVLALLQSVATWLDMAGPGKLWPASSFHLADIEELTRQSGVVVVECDNEVAASAYVQAKDELFWPEAVPGEALYVHKLVVGRSFGGHGLSKVLLDWIAELGRSQGCRFVRLDCPPRPKLLEVYDRAGFSRVGETVEVQDFVVARLQRDLLDA